MNDNETAGQKAPFPDEKPQRRETYDGIPGPEASPPPGTYVPGVCNINMKGRMIRAAGALAGFIFIVIYNEKWELVLVHPVLYTLGLIILAFGTTLSFVQSMLAFCVFDGLLGRTFISGHEVRVSEPDHKKDRRRALLIVGGSFVVGAFFAALLLIEELNRSIQ